MEKFSLYKMRRIKKEELSKIRKLLKNEKENFPPQKCEIKEIFSDKINIIAEIKMASPSEKNIKIIDPLKQAELYIRGGANAISILTDKTFFNGNWLYIKKIRKKFCIPILCKEFIYFKEQIDLASKFGATFILLIVKTLSKEEIKELYLYAHTRNIIPLLEIHEYEEYSKIENLSPPMILINNRNLETLKIEKSVGLDTIKKLPSTIFKIAASGIYSKEDIKKIYELTGVNTFLIGTSIMKHPCPDEFIRELKNVY